MPPPTSRTLDGADELRRRRSAHGVPSVAPSHRFLRCRSSRASMARFGCTLRPPTAPPQSRALREERAMYSTSASIRRRDGDIRSHAERFGGAAAACRRHHRRRRPCRPPCSAPMKSATRSFVVEEANNRFLEGWRVRVRCCGSAAPVPRETAWRRRQSRRGVRTGRAHAQRTEVAGAAEYRRQPVTLRPGRVTPPAPRRSRDHCDQKLRKSRSCRQGAAHRASRPRAPRCARAVPSPSRRAEAAAAARRSFLDQDQGIGLAAGDGPPGRGPAAPHVEEDGSRSVRASEIDVGGNVPRPRGSCLGSTADLELAATTAIRGSSGTPALPRGARVCRARFRGAAHGENSFVTMRAGVRGAPAVKHRRGMTRSSRSWAEPDRPRPGRARRPCVEAAASYRCGATRAARGSARRAASTGTTFVAPC